MKRRKNKRKMGEVWRRVFCLCLLFNMVFTSIWQTELFSYYLLGHLNLAASMSLCLICLLSTALRSGKARTATGSLKEQYKNKRKDMACLFSLLNAGLICLRGNQTPQCRVVLPTLLVRGRFPWKEKRELKTFLLPFLVFGSRCAPQAHSVRHSWGYHCMTRLCRQSTILK